MPTSVQRFFLARSQVQVTLFGLVLVGLFGALDYLTGHEWSFSIFYVVPVAFVTWYASATSGFLVCGLCAATWLAVDLNTGYALSNHFIHYWNALVRLAFFVLTAYLLSQLKDRLEYEKRLAKSDGLTGLLNLQGLKQEADRLLQLAGRYQHPVAVGFIDLDNFKAVNDSRGHPEGDRVLRMVAETLEQRIRVTDLVARVGGDEFVVVLAETQLADARGIFDRIHQDLTSAAQKAGWPVGFSIGVAGYATAPTAIDQALKSADRLMYRVKTSGKNRVSYEAQGQAL